MESLSVIIPNYNKDRYLNECVSSILMQSYLPSEIIIVDDCSTDKSRVIIQKLAKKYKIIKPIFLDKNGGVSRARNLGLKHAVSDIVTFIDSDDYYYNPDKLKNEIEYLLYLESKGYNPLVYSTTVIVDENGEKISCRNNSKQNKREFIKGTNALKTLVALSKQNRIPRDYCIRKSCIVKAGAYSYPRNFYEDLDLLMRLAKQKVYFQPTYKAGTAYRQVMNGLSKQTASVHEKEITTICKHYMSDLNMVDKIFATSSRWIVQIRKRLYHNLKSFLIRMD